MRYPDVIVTGSLQVIRTKNVAEYQATFLIEHYVMLEQALAEAPVLSRQGDGWTETRVAGLDGSVRLTTVDVELPMAACCTEEACSAAEWADVRSLPLT